MRLCIGDVAFRSLTLLVFNNVCSITSELFFDFKGSIDTIITSKLTIKSLIIAKNNCGRWFVKRITCTKIGAGDSDQELFVVFTEEVLLMDTHRKWWIWLTFLWMLRDLIQRELKEGNRRVTIRMRMYHPHSIDWDCSSSHWIIFSRYLCPGVQSDCPEWKQPVTNYCLSRGERRGKGADGVFSYI